MDGRYALEQGTNAGGGFGYFIVHVGGTYWDWERGIEVRLTRRLSQQYPRCIVDYVSHRMGRRDTLLDSLAISCNPNFCPKPLQRRQIGRPCLGTPDDHDILFAALVHCCSRSISGRQWLSSMIRQEIRGWPAFSVLCAIF